jgi:hypothetical protein
VRRVRRANTQGHYDVGVVDGTANPACRWEVPTTSVPRPLLSTLLSDPTYPYSPYSSHEAPHTGSSLAPSHLPPRAEAPKENIRTQPLRRSEHYTATISKLLHRKQSQSPRPEIRQEPLRQQQCEAGLRTQ